MSQKYHGYYCHEYRFRAQIQLVQFSNNINVVVINIITIIKFTDYNLLSGYTHIVHTLYN